MCFGGGDIGIGWLRRDADKPGRFFDHTDYKTSSRDA
jgi:hypothetical protein